MIIQLRLENFFFVINKKFDRVFLYIFRYQVIDSSSTILNYQISYSSYHPGLPPLITPQLLNNQNHTYLSNSISHIYMDAIHRIILQIITEVHYTIQRFTNKDH
jgi:hypothetical protein